MKCRWCDAEIMLVGERWYNKRTADITGWCSKNPYDDLHAPEKDTVHG